MGMRRGSRLQGGIKSTLAGSSLPVRPENRMPMQDLFLLISTLKDAFSNSRHARPDSGFAFSRYLASSNKRMLWNKPSPMIMGNNSCELRVFYPSAFVLDREKLPLDNQATRRESG